MPLFLTPIKVVQAYDKKTPVPPPPPRSGCFLWGVVLSLLVSPTFLVSQQSSCTPSLPPPWWLDTVSFSGVRLWMSHHGMKCSLFCLPSPFLWFSQFSAHHISSQLSILMRRWVNIYPPLAWLFRNKQASVMKMNVFLNCFQVKLCLDKTGLSDLGLIT